jgi:large subunit ribosomal protein L16
MNYLQPRKEKYRKIHKALPGKGNSSACTVLNKGVAGLKILEAGRIKASQIESARRMVVRYLKREGKVVFNIFPHFPVTKKAAETRMGSGKGAIDHHTALVRPGIIIIEVIGVSIELAVKALDSARAKLSLKSKVVVEKEGVI